MRVNRREILAGGAAALAGGALLAPGPAGTLRAAPVAPLATGTVEVELVARRRSARIMPAPAGPSPVVTYADAFPGPVVRMRKGQRLRATLVNELDEHTSIHWHGIRLPNGQDGVPFLTQPPTRPGERFVYDFVPPDSGSFFFHPHCNTVEMLGRGLAGILIVEDNDGPVFDADLPIVVKDWVLKPDGQFGVLTSDRGAGKAGTFGTVSTVNGVIDPTIDLPAGGDVRLRLYNIDNTRVMDLRLEGAEAHMIAVDGAPLPPRPLVDRDGTGWMLGPAMRIDIAFRAPKEPGRTVRLVNVYAPEPRPLASLRTTGPALVKPAFRPRALPAHDIAVPDLKNAEVLKLDLSATAVAQSFDLPLLTELPEADSLCLSQRTFWAIAQKSWPEDGHQRLPPPIATLKQGRTYILEVANLTPHLHPLHLHGFFFLVLGSDKRTIPRHHADTVLLEPKERIRIAFKADNPGDWMVHCHIIEHQETGMMGYLRVA